MSNVLKWAIGTVLYLTNLVLSTQFESFSDSILYPDHNPNDHMYDEAHEYDHEAAEMPYAEKDLIQKYVIPKTKPEPCDNEMWLYSLVHYTERNISNSGYNKSMIDCTRPYIVQRVSGSNMILLVINDLCRPDEDKIALDPEPVQVDYNMTLSCYRAINDDFPRNQEYMSCINKNVNESEIKLCGKASTVSPLLTLPVLVFVLRVLF